GGEQDDEDFDAEQLKVLVLQQELEDIDAARNFERLVVELAAKRLTEAANNQPEPDTGTGTNTARAEPPGPGSDTEPNTARADMPGPGSSTEPGTPGQPNRL